MAITGRFEADFSQFTQAVEQAEVKLRSFESNSNKVESSLSRMTNAFSGTKVIQDAQLMAEAVERVGGVSKLTDSELRRVGSTASEAAAKLRALGLDVPDKIANIAKHAEGASTQFMRMGDVVGRLAGAFGIAFGVGAIVNFGKEVFNAADQLTKLEARTGLSVEALQRFQVAGDDAGNTIDEIAASVTAMQNKIAGGDDAAAKALERLQISVAEFKALEPDQQFIAISDAMREIEDPAEQVSLAMDLMGRTGANVLPTLKRGFDDVRDSVVGMSNDAVRTLDETGDAVTRFWQRTKGAAGEALAFLIDAGPWRELRKMEEATAALAQETEKLPPVFQKVEQQIGMTVDEALKWDAGLKTVVESQIKLNQEVEKFTGVRIVESADMMLSALKSLEAEGLRPMPSALDGMVSGMRRAQEALISTGNTTDEAWQKFDALEKKIRSFQGLDPDTGLLPSTNLGVGLAQAPTVGPSTTPLIEGLQQLIQYEKDLESAVEETGVTVIGTQATHASATASMASDVDMVAERYRGLRDEAIELGSTIVTLAERSTASLEAMYAALTRDISSTGFGVSISNAQQAKNIGTELLFRQFSAPPPTVNVYAQGSYFNTPESMQRLGETIGGALNARIG